VVVDVDERKVDAVVVQNSHSNQYVVGLGIVDWLLLDVVEPIATVVVELTTTTMTMTMILMMMTIRMMMTMMIMMKRQNGRWCQ
jgi:hypothetical protein